MNMSASERNTHYYRQNPTQYAATRRNWLRHRKQFAIEYLGGKCKECGGTFHPACYDFHHRDPAVKSFAIGPMLRRSLAKVKAELDKCDLLCAHCHRILHYKEA